MRFILKLLMVVVFSLCAMGSYAQSIGDKLFAQGQKLQMVQTVKSQNLAISKFIAAQKAYDSSAKKNMCDNQIAICRNNIKTLSQKQTVRNSKVRKPNNVIVEDDSLALAPKVERDPVNLYLSVSYIEFKASGKANDKHEVVVNCNYDSWEFSCPEWVQSAKNGNTLILIASANSTSEDRSGKLTVTCYDKTAELVIYQKSKFSIKSIFGSKKK
ncbi:BACON domain-containing protein [uncultured Prevotella sp.]|uniref:BACON domain-containing protein n=1 Tax=uncultured Prevotella sp. TaxID=159272 RepID=UPI00266FA023|nr:BACON domain-containing protein [uncultured Prevotella sp.]